MQEVPMSVIERFNLMPSDVIALAELQRHMNKLTGNAQRAAQLLVLDSAFATVEAVLASLCEEDTTTH